MKEVFEEYGTIIIATVSSALLIGFAVVFLSAGEAFDRILFFSQNIC